MGAVLSWLMTALGVLALVVMGAVCLTILILVWLANAIVRCAERLL